MEISAKSYIELFHLLFMEQLGQKLDKRLYALKGGCNLRFFLGSIRYSEDIDLDVQTVAPTTLKNTVNKILTGIPFEQILKTKTIRISDFSTPKQTATTQLWKIQLITPVHSLPVNTKIEFSRRNALLGAFNESISKNITLAYNIRPIYMTHYAAEEALEQKIKALILRNETQARDIFDIYHLSYAYEIKAKYEFTKKELATAIENAMGISFAEFKAQVISYLEPAYHEQYDNPSRWNEMVTSVCNFLEDHSV